MVLPLILAGLSWALPTIIDWFSDTFNNDYDDEEEDYNEEEYEDYQY